ncbi:MAG: S-adenosylhomocysteine deaminase, partial [Syntrophobacteraceae bacterium CG07_land_8_20_14_0_80_61_8]
LGGAAALGLAELTGSIEAGKKADLVALDLRQPHLTPLYDPVSHLVYCARASDVTQVWIDGRRVVQDRRVLTLDGDEVRREAAAAGAMIGRGR